LHAFIGKEPNLDDVTTTSKTQMCVSFSKQPYHFLLLLSLPSIPTPSQFYTNRPLWVRALLTSQDKNKDIKIKTKTTL
jgi:hypothetical protein